jgi:hypothetical protein
MADLKKFHESILSDQDKTLFQEATVSASKGAPRGAYILLWITVAESLKRKFKEAALRDTHAGRIVGEIKTAESAHKSVDMLILKRAKEYGFNMSMICGVCMATRMKKLQPILNCCLLVRLLWMKY